MQTHLDRKEAIRKYKETAPPRGVFAIRCTAPDRAWVGASQNLGAAKNRVWFTLRNGSHPDKTLQSEWNGRGDQAFQFEILEKLAEDVDALSLTDVLKEKRRLWAEQLNARALDGVA
jgi:hypothetical protein